MSTQEQVATGQVATGQVATGQVATGQVASEHKQKRQDPIIQLLKLLLIALVISLVIILMMECMSSNTMKYAVQQCGGFFMPNEIISLDIMTPSEITLSAIDGLDILN